MCKEKGCPLRHPLLLVLIDLKVSLVLLWLINNLLEIFSSVY